MIDQLEAFESWVGRRIYRPILCRLFGHPTLKWCGPDWISVSRECPRCGADQFIRATGYTHEVPRKKLRDFVCRHAHCGKPIYYSDFTGSWCHWSTAGEPGPNNTMAEPIEEGPKDDCQGRY